MSGASGFVEKGREALMKERIYTERINITLPQTLYHSIKEYIDDVGISNSKFIDLSLNYFFSTNAVVTTEVLLDARFKERDREPLTERFVCYLTAAMSNEINDYAKENKISKIRVARQALIDYLKILKNE